MTQTNLPEKLSREQLIEFCAVQLEINAFCSKKYYEIMQHPVELYELIQPYGSWGGLYEIAFDESVGKIFTLADIDTEELEKIICTSGQKHTSTKKQLEKLASNLNPPEETSWMLLPLLMAMYGHFRCLEKFAQSMDQLLAKGRAGDDKALLCAVRIDPAVIHAYSFQARLCRTLLQNDTKFLQSLSKALVGKSPDLPSNKLDELRYLIGTLVVSDYFKLLSHEEWSEIFIDDLSIYPKSGKDVHASCKKQIQLILKKVRK